MDPGIHGVPEAVDHYGEGGEKADGGNEGARRDRYPRSGILEVTGAEIGRFTGDSPCDRRQDGAGRPEAQRREEGKTEEKEECGEVSGDRDAGNRGHARERPDGCKEGQAPHSQHPDKLRLVLHGCFPHEQRLPRPHSRRLESRLAGGGNRDQHRYGERKGGLAEGNAGAFDINACEQVRNCGADPAEQPSGHENAGGNRDQPSDNAENRPLGYEEQEDRP